MNKVRKMKSFKTVQFISCEGDRETGREGEGAEREGEREREREREGDPIMEKTIIVLG